MSAPSLAQFAHLMRPIRASAPVAPVRDRAPVFAPKQSGSPRAVRALPEMPELESHDMMSCDNDTDHLSFAPCE